MRRIRLHDIRHTYVTLAATSVWDSKVLCERVGHENETVTNQIYNHRSATKRKDRKAAKTVAKIIQKALKKAA